MNTVYEPPKTDVRQDQDTFDPPLFSANGRIGRLRYIAHSMWLTGVVYLIGAGLGAAVVGLVNEALGGIIVIATMVATVVVQFLFIIKRCHDFNASGWWSVLAIIPLVGLIFAFIPGTDGANRFGSPPSPNTPLIIAGALILPLIFVVGIVAAIAIPAYQEYIMRSQVGQLPVEPAAIVQVVDA